MTKEVRAKYYPEAKRKADEQVLAEVRTKKSDEERLALQLPLLREEVAEEYHGDLKDTIRDQLTKEVTNRVQQSNHDALAAKIRKELTPVLRKELREEVEKQVREENKQRMVNAGLL